MTQNIFSDVRTCLNDAMDTMFNSEQSNSNHGGFVSAGDLKSMMNKRKLAYNDVINEEQMYPKNGNDSTKRLCTTNGHQHEQKS